MGNLSSLIVLNPAIQTPGHAADLLAGVTSQELAANLGALTAGLERAGLDEEGEGAVQELFAAAPLFFGHQAEGQRVQAFGPKRRLLRALRQMSPGSWQRGREAFGRPHLGTAFFGSPGQVRTILTRELGGPAAETDFKIDLETIGFEHLTRGDHAQAADAFWRGAVSTEQTGEERGAAQFYLYAAACWEYLGRFAEAYCFYAIARWYARLACDVDKALDTRGKMEKILRSIRSGTASPDAPQIEPVFENLVEGLESAWQNDFRRASVLIRKAGGWFAQRDNRFIAGNVYKLLGDILVRGEKLFQAMTAYTRAGQELEGNSPYALQVVRKRYAETFVLALGPVRSREEAQDKVIALYERQVGWHRRRRETRMEAWVLQTQIRNLVEAGRGSAAVSAARRLVQLHRRLDNPLETANYLYLLANLLWSEQGKCQEALRAFDEAFFLFDKEKRRDKGAEVLAKWSEYLAEEGSPSASGLKYYQLAEYYLRHWPDKGEEALKALLHAVGAFSAEKMALALETLEVYMKMATVQLYPYHRAIGCMVKGRLLAGNQKFGDAAQAFKEAYKLLVKMPDRREEAVRCLVILSYYYERQGDSTQAVMMWGAAIREIYYQLGEVTAPYACSRQLLAGYLEDAGELEEAARYYTQAAQRFQKHRDPRAAETWEKVGGLQRRLRRWQKAKEAYALAHMQFLRLGDEEGPARVGKALNNLFNDN